MTDQGEAAINTASLSLFRFASLPARLWVLGQMGAARLAFMRMPEVGFYKLCGSGTGEGFTPRPNTAVWAILATWPDAATARDRLQNAAVFQRWRAKSSESWTVLLEPTSARGKWAGVAPFSPTGAAADGPIVALTRASMRASRFLRFWQRVPDISAVIGQDPNVIFKIGIGEVPLLHQVTFSIWPDAASMANFARGDGPHGRAIAAVRAENWFSEELYARFRILDEWGSWDGKYPIAPKDAA
ncbi:spheroidene monooxygenase [Cypionkella sp.]|uniref:spheroidene monooxygenase n=1 Tax=Cypionkella sp. TaxID=2811411 RepID=UPI002FDDF4E5